MIDLRSDTITKPSQAMREAMARAEVGDDVYGEDPTINRLEAMASERTGKEAALFISSGSMGNLIPLFINGGRGNEVITHRDSHIMSHEVGSVAAIAGVLPQCVDTPRGLLTAQAVRPLLRERSYMMSRTTMIEVENTFGGICYPLEQLQEIKTLGDTEGLAVHMDGARFWNAVIATRVDPVVLASTSDTLTFCLSKGLGAPVGSLLLGSREFIEQARHIRKMLGGGMRQAGILAAAGIYALEHNIERLAEDHERAQRIAQALKHTQWADITIEDVQTNIIFVSGKHCDGKRVEEVLNRHGIACFGSSESVRLVTHLNLSDEDISEVCSIIERIDEKEFL